MEHHRYISSAEPASNEQLQVVQLPFYTLLNTALERVYVLFHKDVIIDVFLSSYELSLP